MKKITTYIFALLILIGCSKGVDDGGLVFADGEGCIEFNIELPSTRALSAEESAAALANSVLKIYSVDATDGTESLVRRYEPATEMPEVLYIAAGSYKATLSVGDETVVATTDYSQMCFYGECDITVVESQSSAIDLTCSLRNSIVEVSFDSSIGANFADGYTLSVVASSESGFTTTIFEASDLSATFTESGSIYFLMDGDDAPAYLLWKFEGQRVIEDTIIDSTPISITGKMNAPGAQEKSILTFKYSNYLEFSSEFFTVDYSTEDHDDTLHFSPQPAISASGFSVSDILSSVDSYTFTIRGLNPLSSASVSIDNVTITDGVTFTIDASDSTLATLTLTSETFASISSGESKTVRITAYDEDGGDGTLDVTVVSTGVSSLSNINYWLNTATVTGVVSGSSSTVSFEYRVSGDSEWIACGTTTSNNGTYTASIEASWSSAYSNDSYSLLSGIMAGNTYDIRMLVDGVEYTKSIAAGGTQHSITGPADGNSCYTASNSSDDWGSGNNSVISGLCSYDSSTSSASLTAKALIGNFAAGNLFYGQFSFNSNLTGTVKFGQEFDWTSRPKSFKFSYKATVGTCDYEANTSYHSLREGDTDPARVFLAIVDWSGRHSTTSGSGTPSGTWDPEKQSSTDEGKIIGYASIFITESTSAFVDEEIEIFYYDKVTQPSNNISIVISATTSAYGDYMSGSTSNRLYIKNFGFGY